MKEFILENMDCADCSIKIENGLKRLEGVNFVSVNFATSKLVVDAEDIDEVIDRIKKIEPEVEVKELERSDYPANRGILAELFRGPDRFRNMFFLILPAFLFAMAFIKPMKGLLAFRIGSYNLYVSDLLFILAYILSGWQVLKNAVVNAYHLQFFDENFLMSVATVGAFFIDAVPEAAGVMLFYRIGEYFQDTAVNRSRRSISHLLAIQPRFANLVTDKGVVRTEPERVNIGDKVLVKPGEKIPLDGTVIDGSSQVDNSPITGESVPQTVEIGDKVFAGSINQSGVITVVVERTFDQSSISKILHMVENAVEKKSKSEKFITRFSRYYTPLVMVGVVLISTIPPFVFKAGNFDEWLYRALVMLVISCPCAFVISIPLSYFGGIGKASRIGVLVKGSNYMDLLSQARVFVFDKTGTLTKGTFRVVKINPVHGVEDQYLIKWAKIAESLSDHPIARSIGEYGGSADISNVKIEDYKEIKGKGVLAIVEGNRLLCGNRRLLFDEGIDVEEEPSAGSTVYVALNGKYLGNIVISDVIRPEAREMVKRLRELGVKRIGMLTGDRERIARTVKEELGLDFYFAELLPEEKVFKLEEVIKESAGLNTAFVGDGINDAPVIARADVGIAMGAYGTDAAIEAADVVLMSENLKKIPESIAIAKKTRKVVIENIVMSLVVKLLFLVLGGMGMASMWEAVFGDVGVSLIAILNALRILH